MTTTSTAEDRRIGTKLQSGPYAPDVFYILRDEGEEGAGLCCGDRLYNELMIVRLAEEAGGPALRNTSNGRIPNRALN